MISIQMQEYLDKITEILKKIETEERTKLDYVAKKVADVIANDKIVYIFGCGHSHLPGLDAFYRAGGLANVSPMLDTDLMLHNGAAKSSRMEKMGGIGKEIYRRYGVKKGDILIAISASGKNQVPCDIADMARADGIFTVGISSASYFSKGAILHKHVNVHVDCKIEYGDACIDVGDLKMGGLSTYAACYILNTVLIEGALIAEKSGCKAPIYLSGNVEGGRDHNIILEDRYFERVKHL